MLLNRSPSWRQGSRPQPVNPAQDLGEQAPGYGNLGQLERDIATVADYLRSDLDQLLSKRRQRPMFHRLGQGERAQEIAQVVGEQASVGRDP